MRSYKSVALAGVLALLAPWATPVSAAPAPEWTVVFDREVAGDAALAGNTVTVCPAAASSCRDAEAGTANGALNNNNAMEWADTDGDPGTFNSSGARLVVPAGARIEHAALLWAGAMRDGSAGPCASAAAWPPGGPQVQRVVLSVGRAPAVAVTPTTFDPDPMVRPGTDRWYSAHADVTAAFAGVAGPMPVTVGNVWTGQGSDCFGGWSLVAVWTVGDPPAARRRVVVSLGHARASAGAQVALRPPGLRSVGGSARLGVVAYEGDRGLVGDALLVGGAPQPEPTGNGGPNNFFVSNAAGALAPAHVNNMSVDAKTVPLAAEATRPGATGIDVEFAAGGDDYLAQALVLSLPRPGLSVGTTVDRPAAHPGERVTQRAVVTNTGAVPVDRIEVALDVDGTCRPGIAALAPGRGAEVSCAGPAGEANRSLTARATGVDPSGAAVTATAAAAVRVIHPRLAVRVSVAHPTVLAGEPVEHTVLAVNSGDAPLSAVRLRATGLAGCDRQVAARLAPGESAGMRCTSPAGESGVVTADGSARDELGAGVAASGSVRYPVVRAGLAIDLAGPDTPLERGAPATVTVRVRNTATVPLTAVEVDGEPAGCGRAVGRLTAAAAVVYTCRVPVVAPTVVDLTASGIPELAGRPVPADLAVRQRATLELMPAAAQGQQAPPDPPVTRQPATHRAHPAATGGPLRSPATPAIIAVVSVLVLTVSIGGLSSAIRPRAGDSRGVLGGKRRRSVYGISRRIP